MTIEEIKNLECKIHIKIYKLSQLGLNNTEIAETLGVKIITVADSLKCYKQNEELKSKADLI